MKKSFEVKSTDFAFCDIYVAGDRTLARHFCQEYCMKGLCVNVSDCDYVYTGGSEAGVKVTLINYARYPSTQSYLTKEALCLGEFLATRLHQSSFSVISPDGSRFVSRRCDD